MPPIQFNLFQDMRYYLSQYGAWLRDEDRHCIVEGVYLHNGKNLWFNLAYEKKQLSPLLGSGLNAVSNISAGDIVKHRLVRIPIDQIKLDSVSQNPVIVFRYNEGMFTKKPSIYYPIARMLTDDVTERRPIGQMFYDLDKRSLNMIMWT